MSPTTLAPNLTKRALQAGETVVGTMLAELRQPSAMQLLRNGGFQFAIIDNEHGAFGIETLANLCKTGQYIGLTPIVRVPDFAYPYVAQTLDVGAQGIMLPRVTDPQQVRDVVQMMKYPPVGTRGNALNRGWTDFKAGPVGDWMAEANQETMLVVQVETKQALDAVEEIADIPEVDVIFVGPNDLSISLGVPGQLTAPLLVEGIEKVIAVCREKQVFSAIQMNSIESAAHWAGQGIQMMSAGSDVSLLMQAGQAITSAVREAWEK